VMPVLVMVEMIVAMAALGCAGNLDSQPPINEE
jgi:hypothetical protein